MKYEGQTKVSSIVPGKIQKTAVGRNKLRRKMYEAIKPFIGSIIPGQLIVVCAKSPAVTASFADLSKEMKILFVKTDVLK
jgi:ribonuclease P protein component